MATVDKPIIDLESALNTVGLSMYSEELAAELLAWFYHFGASNEAVVHDSVLSQALECAGRKIGFIDGGGQPNIQVLAVFHGKLDELRICIKQEREFPPWLLKILKRYGLRHPRVDYDFLGNERGQGALF
jgi:hypothetical protein